jgi:phosphatidylglycerophosphate synthase
MTNVNVTNLNINKVDMKKARRSQREFTTHALRYISRPISYLVIRFTKITPNQVTFLSLYFGILAGIFLMFGGFRNHLIAGIFAMLYILFDLMDGEIARVRNLCTDTGKWLDGIIGLVMTPYLLFSLAVGLGGYKNLLIGAMAMVCFPIQYAIIYYYKFDIVKNEEKMAPNSKLGWMRRLYGSVTFYPLLFLALVFNGGFYLLLFYALFGNFFWMIVLLTQYLTLQKIARLSLENENL